MLSKAVLVAGLGWSVIASHIRLSLFSWAGGYKGLVWLSRFSSLILFSDTSVYSPFFYFFINFNSYLSTNFSTHSL